MTIILCTAFLVFVVLLAVFIPLISDVSPTRISLRERLKPPGTRLASGRISLLGTDELGRDILIRALYGARVSLLVGISAVFVAGAIGVTLGVIAGYFGGKTDLLIMRLAEIQLAFPGILLALVIVSVIGPSVTNLVISLGITRWVSYARLARGSVLSIKEREYVECAKALGARESRVIVFHVLPQILTPILVLATTEFGRVIIAEASLSFLGLGIQPPIPSWGGIISDGRNYLNSAWWISTFPGLIVCLVATVAGILGDAIRDRLDPHMKNRL